jgi:hypothetical protein
MILRDFAAAAGDDRTGTPVAGGDLNGGSCLLVADKTRVVAAAVDFGGLLDNKPGLVVLTERDAAFGTTLEFFPLFLLVVAFALGGSSSGMGGGMAVVVVVVVSP